MTTNQAGPLALVGSGEYLPVMADIEAALISGRPPRYVQLATAAVPDGAVVVERWHRLGIEQAERIGVTPVIVPVATREDADDPVMASLVEGAGLIYLSGGNPNFLAETLRGTAVWAAIEATWRSGAALAGCIADLRGSASPATTHEVAKPQFVSADNPRASRHSLTDSDLRAPWSGAAVPVKRKRS